MRTYRNLRLQRVPAKKQCTGRGRARVGAATEACKVHERRVAQVVGGAFVLLALAVTSLVAQEVPAKLTLDDAIAIAQENNPGFLSTQNDAGPANWGVRQAYAAFLPTASSYVAGAWRAGGAQQFGSVTLGSAGTNYYQTGYNLGVSWQLNGRTIFGVPAARAQAKATDARIAAAAFDLASTVTLQYLLVLRDEDAVDVARRQVDRATQNLQIVQAKVSSGAVAGTDGTQAQVNQGQAQVTLIKAERKLREDRALLAEQLGVPVDNDVQLVSQFQVFQPEWSRDSLIDMALSSHPTLKADEAQASAARASARQAASAYFPTLNLSTGWSGFAQQATNEAYVRNQVISGANNAQMNCQIYNFFDAQVTPIEGYPKDCSQYIATDAAIQAALDRNSSALTNFSKNPLSVQLSVSIPIFTGFSRQQQTSQARAQADDARQAVRAELLTLRTRVTQAYDGLTAAYEVVQVETRNKQLAAEGLTMKRRQYQLGAVPLLDLLDAQTTATTADQSYLNAVYDFHLSLVQLDAAVGRRLEHD